MAGNRGLGELETVLQYVDAGQVGQEVNEAINKLALRIARGGGKGKINLEITFSKAGENRVQIDACIKTKEPLPVRESSLFYVPEGGGLSRSDPNKPMLPGLIMAEGGRE